MLTGSETGRAIALFRLGAHGVQSSSVEHFLVTGSLASYEGLP
jgi:hypothetical protein